MEEDLAQGIRRIIGKFHFRRAFEREIVVVHRYVHRLYEVAEALLLQAFFHIGGKAAWEDALRKNKSGGKHQQ
jgi:rhodanese-related sulfurtransferase